MENNRDANEGPRLDRKSDRLPTPVAEPTLEPVVRSWGIYCYANVAGWTDEEVGHLAHFLDAPSRQETGDDAFQDVRRERIVGCEEKPEYVDTE